MSGEIDPLESFNEGNIVEYAESKGCMYLKIQAKRGWPDRLFLYNGHTLFMEVKRRGEKPTKLQGYIHGKLRTNGFDVAVVDSVQLGRDAIDRFTKDHSDF